MIKFSKHYFWNIAYGLDVFIASFWPVGEQGQTISGKLGYYYEGSIPELFVDWLLYYTDADHDHCEDAAEHEAYLRNNL